MIKTLYLRVVLTYSSIVFISLLVAFPTAMTLFTNRFIGEIQKEMLSIVARIAQLQEQFQPQDVDAFLNGFSDVRSYYYFMLYDERGGRRMYGAPNKEQADEPEAADVRLVLSGQDYKTLDFRTERDPNRLMVGVPMQVRGQPYALFILPKFFDRYQEARWLILVVLLIVLVIGSLLILIASRYVVNPLKKLTLATKRLARGDFNVAVRVKQKDELGELAASFNHMAGELKQLEQMRQDFVSNVSHEIQSPLTSIRGFSKALRRPDLGAEDRDRYLEIIERESERLSRLSENLLKLASLESEHHPFHPVPIDLDEQLRKVVLAFEPLWSAKQLKLELTLPKTKLVGDEDQLRQVWTNLFHNSVKFTPEGGTVRIELRALTQSVKVRIADTGIGIHPAEREQVFQRFFKADASRQAMSGGSGLGLAIVKKIVDIHHGTITLDSEPGRGTEMTVELPATHEALVQR
ncbi:HAMP domain-containing histidine kinase [Paenibacillus athensensis]|uniref:Heme sensor protein HssS n=1 Tax=Paenibacillus athensensis TaxID=1967502 RepID=A0A4Y8QAE5_9BACL|nr:HAMP domain-containing sensor histidine kinase [Paenibacillus athensensis]MCD1259117.1 HAMP domain-containing histidine kinase [Paenibacillus athensensis]